MAIFISVKFFFSAILLAISFNSSSLNLLKLTIWNLCKKSLKSSLFDANAPVFGFWVQIIIKSSFLKYFFFFFLPGISTHISSLSKEDWIHWIIDFWTKFTSSNNNIFPFIYASINGPSIKLKPDQFSLFEINLPIKSSILVSELKFNLINLSLLPKILHNTSIDFVFDVPVSPSSTKGIFDSKKKFIFCILSIASFVGINIPFILMFSHDLQSRLYSFNSSIEGISIF